MGDISKKAHNVLIKVYETQIEAAEKSSDHKTIETVILPKLRKLDEEHFGFLVEKSTFALTRLFKSYGLDAENARDADKIEKELLPKVKELGIDVEKDLIISLTKVYSSFLDEYIEAKNEK